MTMIEIIKQYNETLNENLLKDIIEYFTPLMMSVASKYSYDRDELFNVCILAMVKAIKKYDDNKGSKITTYVYAYCQEYCTRFTKQQTREIPVEDSYITPTEPPYDIELQIEIEELLINNLTPLEIKIIHMRYGFNDNKVYAFHEINSYLKIKSAFYIHNKAIKKLRETDYIKNFVY